MELKQPGIDVFDRDAATNDGYLYTQTSQLSCKMATKRTSDVILETGEFEGRSVLDLACGDGFYTIQFHDRSKPKLLIAADGALNAVKIVDQKADGRHISCLVSDAHQLPFADNSFDLVLVQSVLHHDKDPAHMIREAFRLAPRILIHEPNGNNLGLKVIEKVSRYHREHGERSYSSRQMRHWIEQAGGSVVYARTAGFVPMFCPDVIARSMKAMERVIELVPLFRWMACAVYVMVGVRKQEPLNAV
jgi:SAM-dependent methyltransferase